MVYRTSVDHDHFDVGPVFHGEKDAFYPLAAMRYVQSLIPGSRLDVLDGVGHLPGMTRPDEVAGFINAYFSGKA